MKTPIWTPFLALLHSRRFIVSVIAFFVYWLTTKDPNLAQYANVIGLVLTTLATGLIWGFTTETNAQTAADSWQNKPVDKQTALTSIKGDLEQVLMSLFDQYFEVVPPDPVPPTPPATPTPAP